jgi:hypothetical protein
MPSEHDPETKAVRSRPPPKKLAPPDTKAFSLVLLGVIDPADERFRRTATRIADVGINEAWPIDQDALPIVLRRGLSLADAQIGQFELICCDCISVFLADSVVKNASTGYLADLYATLRASSEFEQTRISVQSLPAGEEGSRFIARFFGAHPPACPFELVMPGKKARAMLEAVRKLGGGITIGDDAAA